MNKTLLRSCVVQLGTRISSISGTRNELLRTTTITPNQELARTLLDEMDELADNSYRPTR